MFSLPSLPFKVDFTLEAFIATAHDHGIKHKVCTDQSARERNWPFFIFPALTSERPVTGKKPHPHSQPHANVISTEAPHCE